MEKTKHSIRNVCIPDNLIPVLKDWKLAAPKNNIIFCDHKGGYMNADNMVKKYNS